MTKETLQLALEALTDFDYDKRIKAIESIKEALETKDEPVACGMETIKIDASAPLVITRHPAFQKRTWVGLTDDDEIPWDGVDAKSFAKAIEAKLKEKNYDIPN